MRIAALNKTANAVCQFSAKLQKDVKGIAAIEFAFIVPMLMMMFIGALEFGTALTVDRRVSMIASSVADLVSRKDTTSDGELAFIASKIGLSMMKPYDYLPVKIHIISVKADANNAAVTTVDWSASFAGGAPIGPAYSGSYAMPAGLMTKGSSMIVAEVTYDYTPTMFSKTAASGASNSSEVSPGAYQMKEKFYLSPRTKSCVSLNNINCVTGQAF